MPCCGDIRLSSLTSPMYLMVAKSFSPTRIRVPTSKSLTSIRLFMRLQQCVQRPTMLKTEKDSTVNAAAAAAVVGAAVAVFVFFFLLQLNNVMWIAPICYSFFFLFLNKCDCLLNLDLGKFKSNAWIDLWSSYASLFIVCDVRVTSMTNVEMGAHSCTHTKNSLNFGLVSWWFT